MRTVPIEPRHDLCLDQDVFSAPKQSLRFCLDIFKDRTGLVEDSDQAMIGCMFLIHTPQKSSSKTVCRENCSNIITYI